MGIELVAALCAGLAIGLFVMHWARSRQATPADARISNLAEKPRSEAHGLSWDEIRRRGSSGLPWFGGFLSESNWARKQALELEQTGVKMRVGEYLMIRLALGFVTFLIVWLIGQSVISFVLGIVCGFFGYMLPSVWVSVLRKRRIERIDKQLPEAVTMISNALRAGFAFQHGMDMVSKQAQPPISEEFARIMADLNVGASIEEALQGFLDRVQSEDANMVVTAILIQRQSGGNLAEILETVGETMRERERLTGEVKTMTSQQRFSGMVLAVWPLLLLAVFAVFNWSQVKLLFTTNVGLMLVAVGCVLELMGYYTIRRILDIDI